MSVEHVLRPRDAGAVLDAFSVSPVGPAAAARLYAGTPLGGGWVGGATPSARRGDDDDARSRTSTEATPDLPSDLDDDDDGADGGRPFSCDTAALLLNLRGEEDDGQSDGNEPAAPAGGRGGGGDGVAREAAVAVSPRSPPWASAGDGRATPWTPPPPLPLSALHDAGSGDADGATDGGGGLSPHGSPLVGVIRERVDGFERLGRERNSLQAAMGSPGRAALSAPRGGGSPSSPVWLGPAALAARRIAGPAEGGARA